MAVLSSIRLLPGAEVILAVHGPALPQPDQLCGPFAASLALHAVVDDPPDLVDLAAASGTRIWPHDVTESRPAGAPLDRRGWGRLPRADDPADGGTDATGLARGLAEVMPEAVVVPAAGADWSGLGSLLASLGDLDHPIGVLANVRTGPIAATGVTWDVGHFVIVWGISEDGSQVAIADSYAELGTPGLPAGCRLVGLDDLAAALPGRGLLLLAAGPHAPDVRDLVAAAGLTTDLWET